VAVLPSYHRVIRIAPVMRTVIKAYFNFQKSFHKNIFKKKQYLYHGSGSSPPAFLQ
jgi:hypothetical protein